MDSTASELHGQERLLALEGAVAALTERVESLSAQVLQQEDTFSLVSDVARYLPLRDLLAAGRFQEADEQTQQILYDCIGSTVEEITPDAIEACATPPLQIIDRLWRDASSNRFGFTAQLRIYRSLGGSLDTLIAQDAARFRAFCERVGWNPDGLLGDPDDAPEAEDEELPDGALPRRWWSTPYGMKIGNIFMARLITAGFDDGPPVSAPAPSG